LTVRESRIWLYVAGLRLVVVVDREDIDDAARE
jgi:hypothetical protein